eukprot:GFUD01010236.1.p1 GENE.GFUD01010236.1~~GFUD01010236.1.p1  ORF type:complete len:153 (-),score=23.13 GFUD01010236.1:14-472(-)
MSFFNESNSSAAWDFSQKRSDQTNLDSKHSVDSSRLESSNWNSQFNDAASVSSSSSWNSSSSSGRSSGSANNHRFGPTLSLESGYNGDPWRQRTCNTNNTNSSSDRDMVPRFSGMNLGDVMRITVLQEMDKLNMNKSKPLDLSCKAWDLKKR